MRQLANEANGIRHPKPVAFGDVHLAREGVERREQSVLDEHVGTRKGFQQTRLSRVRVPDERGRRNLAPPLTEIRAMLGDVLQPLLEHRDLAANHAAVGFELRFAGSAQPDATADAREVRPHPRQTREQILELRQLDLELGFVTARARRENVENNLGAIHDAHAEILLELDALDGSQRLVEQHQGRTRRRQLILERFDFALAEVEVGRRGVDALDGFADDLSAGGVGEALQLVEVLVHVHRVVGAFSWCPHQEGPLNGHLDVNQFPNTSPP